jgi:hypothetical protein
MGISQSNHHLLIIEGHGSHVSLEVIKHAHLSHFTTIGCIMLQAIQDDVKKKEGMGQWQKTII